MSGEGWFTDVWRGYPAPADWQASLRTWQRHGLTEADLLQAAVKALAVELVDDDQRFRYFAGICWRTIRDRMGGTVID